MQTVVPHMSLAEFDRPHPPPADTFSNRVTAALLTAALGALMALLATQKAFWTMTDYQAPPGIITMLIPDAPRKQIQPPPPPFVTLRLRMRAEKPAPPVFIVAAAETLSAPATLPATAAPSSPLAGGVTIATGTGPQSISADGTNGNGLTLSACWDALWGKAAHDRIGLFYYYPPYSRMHRQTGLAMVHMLVRRDGRLDLVEIRQSSGHSALDQAATDMVRRAQPLPHIPDRMHADRIDAEMAIFFGKPDIFTPTPGNCG